MKMMHPHAHARIVIRLKALGNHFNPMNGCQQSPAELGAHLNITKDQKMKRKKVIILEGMYLPETINMLP